MLNVEFYINGTLNYLSIKGHDLTHNWKPFVIGFDAPTLMVPTKHGGYAKMSFGKITFNPKLFESDWPPPVSGAISIYYTDTTEAARELVFEGTAHLSEYDYKSITYALYGSSYDEKWIVRGVGPLVVGQIYEITNYVAGDDFVNVGGANVTGTIFTATGTTPTVWTNFSKLAPRWNDTLNNVITAILGAVAEISTVNTTYTRASSPNVLHTLVSDTIAVNLAGAIAEFYSHLIYIIGDTAYLVDMLRDNGAPKALTEYQFFKAPEYSYPAPYAKVTTSQDEVIYEAESAYPYGAETSVQPYHETEANIETALANILTLENMPRISNLAVPMIAGNFPLLGQKIEIPDTRHIAALSSWIRARKLTFDFMAEKIQIEGEGGMAAA